jgi:hypothetical protein
MPLVRSVVAGSAPRASRRVLRALVACAVASAALSAAAAAQTPQPPTPLPHPRLAFSDSWFWGVKGGAARFGSVTDGNTAAPVAGVEWLITKRRGALLVSADQAFFDHASAVYDPQAEAGLRRIELRDRRRFSAAVLAFPKSYGEFRPYAGIGLALETIRSTRPIGEFNDVGQYRQVLDETHQGSSAASALGIIGVQAQISRVALFIQASASPAQSRSLLDRGGSQQLEIGMRYNLASATER